MENSLSLDRQTKQFWYLLWAPAGLGGTTARLVELQAVIHEHDKDAIVWYPIRPETINGRTYMKALYAGYIFVKCLWNSMMEDTLAERVPAYLTFLKDSESKEPLIVADGDIAEVEKVLEEILKQPETFLQRSGLKIGDDVKILKKAFFGQIGKILSILPKQKVAVELEMFGRSVPVSFDPRDLQAL